MNSRRLSLAALVLAMAAAAWLGFYLFGQAAAPEGNLAGASVGGPFRLVDQDGRQVSDRDYLGHYRLMYFGYTFCPDVCPTDVAVLAKGLKAFEASDPRRAATVTPIFVTVDPERDTPAVLKQWVAAFHPRLVGLTGTPAAIDAVRKEYGIYAKKATGAGASDYLVDHFAVFYLFGPDGRPVAFAQHGSTPPEITQMLKTYVR